jgi:predicted nucleic acid-binding protein
VTYVDTSVVIRYLTGDDPARTAAAMAIIETRAARAVSIVSILEASHVLRTAYAYERRSIASALIDLISRRNVVVPEVAKDHVLHWLNSWGNGTVGSAGDALIAASMSAHDAEAIATFDAGFPPGSWTVLAGPQP